MQLPAVAGVSALALERYGPPGPPAPAGARGAQPLAGAAAHEVIGAVNGEVIGEPMGEGRWRLGNGLLSVELGPMGLEQLFDGQGLPQLAGPLQLARYRDAGEFWDAWDLSASYPEQPLPIAWTGELEWVEQGPLCAQMRWRGRCGRSDLRLDGRLLAGVPWFELVLSVDWQQRHELLRCQIPLAQPAVRWAADTSGGVLERPAQPLTPREQARWEVAAISWMASVCGGPGAGLGVLLDGPQGVSAGPDALGISLVRGPTWPDPSADNGRQRQRWALAPCPRGWSQAQLPQLAQRFREPLWLRPQAAKPSTAPLPAAERLQNPEVPGLPPLGEGLQLLGLRTLGGSAAAVMAAVISVQNHSAQRRRLVLGPHWVVEQRLDGLDRPWPGGGSCAGAPSGYEDVGGDDPLVLRPWACGFWRISAAQSS